MSEVKTYDLEDTGSAYQQYREMVEQTEYEGDWVRIEDYKKLEAENRQLKAEVVHYQKELLNKVSKKKLLEKENAELKSKVERLENCIHVLHHEEYSYSPDEVERYIKQIYTGQHDQYFKAKIKECLKEWRQGE